MTSIALGVFIVFILYIMIWSIKNDGVRSIREQTGLIRMRESSFGATKSHREPSDGRTTGSRVSKRTNERPKR
jgi:hypothetical protein